MSKILAKFFNLIEHQNFKKVLIIYILFNLGILFTIYGSILYSPAMVPDVEDMTPEGARMEIKNLTKGALIGQNFELNEYNIGFDMLNVGGILLVIGMLYYNKIEYSAPNSKIRSPRLKLYSMRKAGHLKGNVLEWLCLILFLFAFFTFLYNIFVYIIMLSFIVGVIGFSIRKLNMVDLLSNHGIKSKN